MFKKDLNLNQLREKVRTGRVKLACSFCGKQHTQVNKMVAGPGVYICDECILLSLGIMAEDKKLNVLYPDGSGAYKESVIDFNISPGSPIGKVARCRQCGLYIYSSRDETPKCPRCNS